MLRILGACGKWNPARMGAASFVLTGLGAPEILSPMPFTPRSFPAALAPALLCFLALTPGLRAQVTEVPQTIEPGRVLIRMDAISFGAQQDTSAPNEYQALALGTTVVSAGITDTFDVEFGAQLFLHDTFTEDGAGHSESGVGDFELRTKWTFWRDPSSGQEAAVIPYVIVPTGSSVGDTSRGGGLIVPWSMDVAAGLKAGAMLEWDELRNEANTRYDTRWYGSAFAQFAVLGRASVYGESTLSVSTAGSSADTGTVGAGATLSVSGNFKWDFEVSRVIGPGRNQWNQDLRFTWRL